MVRRARKFELHVYIATLFMTLMVAFAATNITMQYLQTRKMLLSASMALFGNIDREMREAIATRYDTSIFAADLIAGTRLTLATSLAERMTSLPVLVQALKDQPSLSAAYVGYDNGDFFLVRRLTPGAWLPPTLKPPATAAYLVQSVERGAGGPPQGRYLFMDSSLKVIEDRAMPDYSFDPRSRPWYASAMLSSAISVAPPYLFFTTREVGTTFARRSPDGHAVAGVDVALTALSDYLRALRPTPSAELALFNEQGELLADANAQASLAAGRSAPGALPRIATLGRPVLASFAESASNASFETRTLKTAAGTWQGLVSLMEEPGARLFLGVAVPQAELVGEAARIRNQSLAVAFALMLIAFAFTLAFSRIASRPIGALTREAASIQALKFDKPVAVRSFIAEIDLLARTMGRMKSTIQRFLDIGAVLAGERRFDRLLQRILEETMSVASARGGAIYLAEPDGRLKGALGRWDESLLSEGIPDLDPARDGDHPVLRAAAKGALSRLANAADLARWYPRLGLAQDMAMLAVPLRNREDEVVGVLVLLQETGTFEEAQGKEVLALVEALSGTAAVAIETQRLILEQKRLLESFIQLVAGAIDRKSPYTGGHCQRVPELTKMIARAAEAATEGPLKGFALNENQWEELHIAAWLHDCGKVTTPEYVVDKATKLETIYDRLHEVRMRFEVLKREAEVACWKAIADGATREAKLLELREFWAVLDEEFAFVATCNEGGE